MASCLRDFTRVNPPTFYGSKVNEDPQEFLDEVYKIQYVMGVSLSEKVELASYELKDVAQTLYAHWRDNRLFRGGTETWEIFTTTFLDQSSLER